MATMTNMGIMEGISAMAVPSSMTIWGFSRETFAIRGETCSMKAVPQGDMTKTMAAR